MDETKLATIRNYLLDKKLPIDILVEVYDHFVTQILELQNEEGVGFEEAFAKVKITWRDELRPYWDGGWDLFDKNNITRTFERMLIWITLKKSIKYSLLVMIILALVSQIISIQFFIWFFLAALILIVIWPVVNLIRRWKTFMLPKKYDEYVLTLYQSFNFINFVFAYSFYQVISRYRPGATRFANFFTNFEFNADLLAVAVYISIMTVSFFALVSQQEYLKRIEKVQPFLKYLKS